MGLGERVRRLEARMERLRKKTRDDYDVVDTLEEARAKVDGIRRRVCGDDYEQLDYAELNRLLR